MAENEEEIVVAIIKHEEKYYVLMNGKSVQGFKNIEQGIKYFEEPFEESYNSITRHWGAILSFCAWNPVIVKISLSELGSFIELPCYTIKIATIIGLQLTKNIDIVKKIYDSGIKIKFPN